MKKTLLLVLFAALVALQGCTTQNGNNPPKDKHETGKGYVYVKFSTAGLASDIVSMKVLINGEQKALLGTTETEFVSRDIDLSKAVAVTIEPQFTDVEAPTEKFDFGYNYSYKIGVTSDGGKSFSSVETDSEDKSMQGVNPDTFQDLLERTKTRLQIVTVTLAGN